AAAEAMTLVRRAKPKAAGPFVVDADALPQTIEVVRTRAEAMGIPVVVTDLAEGLPDGELSGVLVQYPGASGRILGARAPPARSTGWRLGRRRRAAGVPARAADPGAAHPARQGHLQHLHR